MQAESTFHAPNAGTIAAPRAEVLRAALAAAGLGVLLLWGVGFAGSDMLHAAAHDARHSIGFPCH